jgi:hypothetical protein
MILAHLLPLQGDLNRALDSMMPEYSQDVSTHDINWLQSEFRHLVDSTAQERAARHPESTAHAFDQWSYPEDTIGYFKDTAKHQTARSSASSIMSPGQADADSTTWTLRQRRKTPNQTWTMETPAGVLRISMPRHGSTLHASRDTHTVEELGFSCTPIQGRSSYIIEARFLRDLSYSSRPSMYAQLNVFTTVDDSYDEPYTVVMRRGTIADVEQHSGLVLSHRFTTTTTATTYV